MRAGVCLRIGRGRVFRHIHRLEPMSSEPLIAGALLRALPVPATITAMRQIGIGYGHDAWQIATEHHGIFLLKICIRQPTARYFTNEVQTQQLMADHGCPTPEIVAVCDLPNQLGQPFYIQRWIPGDDGDVALPQMSPAQVAAFADDFGCATAAMHQIGGELFREYAFVGREFGSWGAFCTQRLETVVAAHRQVDLLPQTAVRELDQRCSRLIRRLPPTIAPVLTHRDLYLRNTLAAEGRFLTIIDFEEAGWQDGLWDFAKLHAWVFRTYPAMYEPFLAGYQRRTRLGDDADARIALYQGLEYLAALYYFGVTRPHRERFQEFADLITAWLANPADA